MLDCNHNSGPAVLLPHSNAVMKAKAAPSCVSLSWENRPYIHTNIVFFLKFANFILIRCWQSHFTLKILGSTGGLPRWLKNKALPKTVVLRVATWRWPSPQSFVLECLTLHQKCLQLGISRVLGGRCVVDTVTTQSPKIPFYEDLQMSLSIFIYSNLMHQPLLSWDKKEIQQAVQDLWNLARNNYHVGFGLNRPLCFKHIAGSLEKFAISSCSSHNRSKIWLLLCQPVFRHTPWTQTLLIHAFGVACFVLLNVSQNTLTDSVACVCMCGWMCVFMGKKGRVAGGVYTCKALVDQCFLPYVLLTAHMWILYQCLKWAAECIFHPDWSDKLTFFWVSWTCIGLLVILSNNKLEQICVKWNVFCLLCHICLCGLPVKWSRVCECTVRVRGRSL